MKSLVTFILLSIPLSSFSQEVTNDFYTLHDVRDYGNVIIYETIDVHIVQKGPDFTKDGIYMITTQENHHLEIVIDGGAQVINIADRFVHQDHGKMMEGDNIQHTNHIKYRNPEDNSSVAYVSHVVYKHVDGHYVPMVDHYTGPSLQ